MSRISKLWHRSGGLCLLAMLVAPGEAGEPIDYARDVRPILSRACYVCHGPDEGSREAGLRLDRADGALAVLESGVAPIVPGAPDESELLRRVLSSDDDRMPPATSQHSLTEKEKQILREWIAVGAKFDDHWSLRPIKPVSLPSVHRHSWPRNAIDRFVLAKLEELKLEPSEEAGKETLLRRLTFDLTGLPPTSDEVAHFLEDRSEDAYERAVDRLLASPHFGERWGRHWLDIAHYADSDGYLGDALRPNAWLYRDWVLQAVNADMPFDRFTLEQLAGDLVPDANATTKTATGFLRTTLRNTEAGVDLEEYRLKEVVDRVSTIGVGWLGLSLGCAECHSHKYDPISQREFYELFAFFNDAEDVDHPIKLDEEEQKYRRAREAWENQNRTQREELVRLVVNLDEEDGWFDLEDWIEAVSVESKKRNQDQKSLIEKLKSLKDEPFKKKCSAYEAHLATKPSAPSTKIMAVQTRQEPRETWIHLRGDYRQRGETVRPGTPAVLHPMIPRGEQGDRLDLARWLVDPSNPLTPRVIVNQIWARLFGQGIVSTVDNFGTGGEHPSHPELLDWLAHEWRLQGWSRKAMIREIVCSATYRQSAVVRDGLDAVDPLNRWLARQSRLRLEAESVRDAVLAASGLLERRLGGNGIRPPQPAYVTSISRNAEWKVTRGGDLYRRGMYIVLRRATPYPMLLTFDAPDSTVACTRRERSNSPLQALTLLNDPVFFECAQALGHHLASLEEQSTTDRLVEAYQRCLGRNPTAAESQRMLGVHAAILRRMHAEPEAAMAVSRQPAHADSELPWRQAKTHPPTSATTAVGTPSGGEATADLAVPEEASWILLARILLNLDEFITRE